MPQKLTSMFKPGWDENLNANFRAIPTIYALHAEVLLVRKAYIPLVALSKKYLDTARIYPNLMVEIMLHIIVASAYRALGDHKQAVEHLRNALALALPDGILMPFVEFGRYIGPILGQITNTEYTKDIAQILTLSKEYRRQLDEMRQRISQNGGVNLTQQERKIAILAAGGYSNKEIADEMVISESTVKTHLAHAFTKLDIKKRSQLKAIFKE